MWESLWPNLKLAHITAHVLLSSYQSHGHAHLQGRQGDTLQLHSQDKEENLSFGKKVADSATRLPSLLLHYIFPQCLTFLHRKAQCTRDV